MKTIATAIAFATAALMLASPASADVPEQPTVEYPVYRVDGAAAEGDTVIQLEAPARSWGIRRAARLMDAQIPGLTIRTAGTCSANPTALCVRVEIGTYDPERQAAMSGGGAWQGACYCEPDSARVIYLNRYREPGVLLNRWTKGMVAAHELGHALGLGHHTSKGAVATTFNYDEGGLSDPEAAALADWFSVPRYRPQA